MVELFYNPLDKYWDVTKFAELEMDTDSCFLMFFEHDLFICIQPAMKKEWNFLRSGVWTDEFSATSPTNFFPNDCWAKHKKLDKRERVLFKKEFRCTEMICLRSKTYCCYDSQSNNFKFTSKGLNKTTFKDFCDRPMFKDLKVSENVINVTSTNIYFRTIQHAVATYEQTKKGLSHFYPKRSVQQDEIKTRPFKIQL